jgi:hypothetical protein
MIDNTKQPKTLVQSKKSERYLRKRAGGVYKEIKLTCDGLKILSNGKETEGFVKNWEFINYLLNKYSGNYGD